MEASPSLRDSSRPLAYIRVSLRPPKWENGNRRKDGEEKEGREKERGETLDRDKIMGLRKDELKQRGALDWYSGEIPPPNVRWNARCMIVRAQMSITSSEANFYRKHRCSQIPTVADAIEMCGDCKIAIG